MEWSEELCRTFKVSSDKFPRVIKPWEIIGELTEEAAEKCGLVRGIPIAAGAGNFTSSCLGAGMVKPSVGLDVAGTAACFATSTIKLVPDRGFRTLLYAKSVIPELWIPHAYIGGGGLCLRWFRDEIASREKALAEKAGKSTYAILDEEASVVPRGSDGLFFIPHLGGRMYPYNPKMRGRG